MDLDQHMPSLSEIATLGSNLSYRERAGTRALGGPCANEESFFGRVAIVNIAA
jgi:hypothetical protein